MPKLDTSNDDNKKYKMETIWDSAVYTRKSKSGYLPSLSYLIAWKDYSEEENTWKPLSAIQHLKKLISCFYKEHLNNPIATSLPIDSALQIVKPTVQPARSITK